MLRILAIGNSFSQDATRYLQPIAQADGAALYCRNLYIGGCSLERHAENIRTCAPDYQYQEDGEGGSMVSIQTALLRQEWDIVTVQQVSQWAGIPQTFSPYLEQVLATIRRLRPLAEIRFHRTWAYEWGSSHPGFAFYGCDQDRMEQEIARTAEWISREYGLPLVNTGLLIHDLRCNAAFDIRQGGLSLCRDGFHLSLDYGRYAAALLWYREITGKMPVQSPILFDNADPALLQLIWDSVHNQP